MSEKAEFHLWRSQRGSSCPEELAFWSIMHLFTVRTAQAKGSPDQWLPDLHMLMFRYCSDLQEVLTLQPPATNLMPIRGSALSLKFAWGNQDFCYYSAQGGGGALKRRGLRGGGGTSRHPDAAVLALPVLVLGFLKSRPFGTI